MDRYSRRHQHSFFFFKSLSLSFLSLIFFFSRFFLSLRPLIRSLFYIVLYVCVCSMEELLIGESEVLLCRDHYMCCRIAILWGHIQLKSIRLSLVFELSLAFFLLPVFIFFRFLCNTHVFLSSHGKRESRVSSNIVLVAQHWNYPSIQPKREREREEEREK